MIYSGKIADKDGRPIPGARLIFKNDSGQVITQVPVSSTGSFSIDDTFDFGLFSSGIVASFSAPGYAEYFISAVTMPQNFNVTLSKKVNGLAAVGIGAGALLLLAKPGKIFGAASPRKLNKYILPAAGIAAAGFILYKFFGPDPRAKQGQTLPDSASNELSQLAMQGIIPTITKTQAESYAASILQAADQCGTDEPAIYSAFANLSNKADLMLLIKTYGVRTYRACFDGNFFQDTPRNLAETLSAELNASEMNIVNQILSDQGINYSF